MTSSTICVERIVPGAMAGHVGDGVDGTRNTIAQAAIFIVSFEIVQSVEAGIRCTLAIDLIDRYYYT